MVTIITYIRRLFRGNREPNKSKTGELKTYFIASVLKTKDGDTKYYNNVFMTDSIGVGLARDVLRFIAQARPGAVPISISKLD